MNDNNNLNGSVLGSVDASQNNNMPNPSPMPSNEPESLGVETLGGPTNPNPSVNPEPVSPNPIPNPTPVSPMPNPGVSDNGINPTNLNNGAMGMPNDMNNNLNNSGISNPSPMPAPDNMGNMNQNSVPPIDNGNNLGMPNLGQAPVPPVPPVAPEPAYTNPNTITPPVGMPGFESSSTIGTTPPISLEPEKEPKKKTNKVLFIAIILIVLAGVGFGTYYVLNYTSFFNNKRGGVVSIKPKDLEISLGDKLSTNNEDYAEFSGTDSRNCSVDTTNVDVNKAGTYKFTITCGETHREGTINVVDNSELVVAVKTVYKGKGESLEAKEFAVNDDDDLTYEFVSNDEVQNFLNGEAGSYMVKIKVTNKNNKSTEVTAELVVLEHSIKGFITCTSNAQNLTGYNAQMTVAERFAIAKTDTNDFGGIAYEVHSFKFSDETEYNELLESYQTEGKVTINNVTGDTEFDDTTKTITITNIIDSERLKNDFGENNIANYKSINEYFKNTLAYTCVYKNVETTSEGND